MKSQFIKSFFGRYKNTYLGFFWNFISPLIYVILLYLVTIELRGRDPTVIILIMSGVFIYNILLSGVVSGTTCFTGGASLIKKMYFPREILVYIHVLCPAVATLLLYFILLMIIVVMNWGLNIVALLWFPFIYILAILFAIGCALILSSICVYIRDIQHLISSLSIVLFVLTPLRDSIYNISGIRGQIMWYNPFTYYIEPCHQIFFEKTCPDLNFIIVDILLTAIVLIMGAITFRLLKRGFAERL